MGRLAERVLLKEYVREVLKEDDFGGFGGGDAVYGDLAMWDAANNPWGVSFGSGKDLFNIFVKPFTDVVQTAAGKTKELSAKGQTLLRVAFESIATTLIPVLTDSYNEIFEKEKEKLEKIRSEYAEVYKSNWDAFKDEDFQFLSFMYDPGYYIGAKIAQKAPGAALGMLSAMTGGTLDPWIDRVKKEFGLDDKEEPLTGLERTHGKRNVEDVFGSMGGGGYDVGWGAMEGAVREDANEQSKPKPSIRDMLANPKVAQKVNQSPIARKMQRQAQQMVREPLQRVYKQAQAVLGANSLQDLQAKLGKKLPGTEKLAQVPPPQRQVAEQQVLAGVKKSMKEFYVKSLERQAKAFKGGPITRDYEQAIGKIKAL